MKIMFYINTLAGGGAQRVMANLASLLAEDNYDVILTTSFSAENEYELSEKVKRRCLSEKRFSSFLERNIKYLSRLRKLVREEKPDVLISFMAEPNYRCVLAGIGLPLKTIISVRDDPNKEYAGKISHILAKYLLPLADGCVFQTRDAQAWFPDRLQKKSRIIMNTVKEEFYEQPYHPVLGRVVTCGRLHEQKNHKMLIDAFAQVCKDLPSIHLQIYGEGGLREELQNQILEYGLQDRITLMGQTSDVKTVLSNAECFVLSSNNEGMPNALMEAMAVGLSCISTACPCGGPEMLIKNGKSGLLVPVGDSEALAEAMRKVLSDRDYAKQIGQAGKLAAEAFHPKKVFISWKSYIDQFQ